MLARRTLVPAALAAACFAAGCTRGFARKDLARNTPRSAAPFATEQAATQPVSAPLPPTPPRPKSPADPGVAPPRADALAGVVPPIPGTPGTDLPRDLPPAVSDSPVAVVPVGANDPEALGVDRKPLRERIQDRRQQREERRDQRQNPPPADTPPAAPTQPPTSQPPAETEPSSPAPATTQADAARKLVEAAVKQYAAVTDFEARLVKREVVNGKPFGPEEIAYRFRKEPLSVYMKVLSEAGLGREILFVKGQFGNKIQVVTGKGDNALVGAGYKTEVDPDSRTVTAKSRYRIYEAGFSRTLNGLVKGLDAGTVRSLGPVQRPEYPYPLDGVEVTIRPGTDPLLPNGGRRQVFFDPKPDSPSYLLPVVSTCEADGREVEYYSFDRIRLPANFTDADWNPDRLGKKR